MSVAAFPAGASAKTAQGGDLVLSRYKQGSAVVTTTDLPAGNYYLTIEGTGAIFIYSYTGTTTGALITSATASGATTVSLTVPSGVSGIFVSGSYVGPMSFQKITSATPAVVSATSFSEQPLAYDFGNMNQWKKIQNSSKFIRFELEVSPNVYRVLIADAATGQITQYSNALTGYRDNAGNQLTAKPMAAIEANGAIIVSFSSPSGNSPYIYRSPNGRTNWTNVHGMLSGYNYNDVLEYNNGLFMLHSTGSASTAQTNYYTSSNGITWTNRNLPASGNLLDVEYVGGNWVLFTGKGKNSGATPAASTNYYTSSDGITWTTRDYVNPGWKAGAAVYSNTMFVIDENAVIKSSTDGITWSVYADLQSSYSSYGANATGEAFGASIPDNADGTGGAWLPITLDTNTSDGLVVWCRPGQAASVRTYTSSPFATSTEAGQHPMNVNSRLALMSNGSRVLHYATLTGATRRVSGVIGNTGDQVNPGSYYSKKFLRWYFASYSGIYYSDVNDPTKWTLGRALSGSNMPSNFVDTDDAIVVTVAGSAYRSIDGITFTQHSLSQANYPNASGSSLAFYRGKLIAATNGSQIQISNDMGKTWFSFTVTNLNAPKHVASNSLGFFIEGTASTGNGHWYSSDGLNWTQASGSSTSNPMITQGSVNGLTLYKVTSASSGQLMTENINLNKINITYPTTSNGIAVQIGNQIAFVPRTLTATYYTTDNGITWTSRSFSNQGAWRTIGGNDSLFAAQSYVNTDTPETIARVALTNTLTIG